MYKYINKSVGTLKSFYATKNQPILKNEQANIFMFTDCLKILLL